MKQTKASLPQKVGQNERDDDLREQASYWFIRTTEMEPRDSRDDEITVRRSKILTVNAVQGVQNVSNGTGGVETYDHDSG